MRYTRISADCHLDLPWMPPDLFTSNASAAMKERMPFTKDGPDGPYWTCRNGQSFGLVNGVGPAGQKFVPGMHHRVDVMAKTGLYDDGKKGMAGLTPLTFDCLLNCLDGVERADGVFTIISTNDIGKVDPALGQPRKLPDGGLEFISTRPGRIDKAVELTYMELADKKRMAKRILGD